MSGKIKTNRNKKSSVLTVILTIFVVFACVGLFAKIFDIHIIDKSEEPTYKTVYLVPGDNWADDGSNYGAWCWSSTGVPAPTFVLATDDDSDGIFELKISSDYSRMSFVDLKPGETKLGVDWANKREQSADLDVPKGKNIYYHAYAQEWSQSDELLFTITTQECNIKLDNSNTDEWLCNINPVVYYFDKTGKSEAGFVQMNRIGDNTFTVTIPAGYTHLLFIEYSSDENIGSWDNILNQTNDLIIPGNNYTYFIETETWGVSNDSGTSDQ